MSKPDQMSQSYVMSDDAVRFATMIMAGQGVSNEDATVIAECLVEADLRGCLLYTSPSPRDRQKSRMPSSA